ncbi:MAG: hypothetical protein V5A64_07035 [Candidatus Thermoplasmatota archaeon]
MRKKIRVRSVLFISILLIVSISLGYCIGQVVRVSYFVEGSIDSDFSEMNYSELKIPTKKQVKTFMEIDQTDKHVYIKDGFNCRDFSEMFRKNFTSLGYQCFHCLIDYKNQEVNHRVIAVQTIDSGLVFVEPQSDKFIDVYPGADDDGKIISDYKIFV